MPGLAEAPALAPPITDFIRSSASGFPPFPLPSPAVPVTQLHVAAARGGEGALQLLTSTEKAEKGLWVTQSLVKPPKSGWTWTGQHVGSKE